MSKANTKEFLLTLEIVQIKKGLILQAKSITSIIIRYIHLEERPEATKAKEYTAHKTTQ